MTNDGEEVIADYAEMDDALVTITVFSIGRYRVLRIGATVLDKLKGSQDLPL